MKREYQHLFKPIMDVNEIEGGELDNGQANFGELMIDMLLVLLAVFIVVGISELLK